MCISGYLFLLLIQEYVPFKLPVLHSLFISPLIQMSVAWASFLRRASQKIGREQVEGLNGCLGAPRGLEPWSSSEQGLQGATRVTTIEGLQGMILYHGCHLLRMRNVDRDGHCMGGAACG